LSRIPDTLLATLSGWGQISLDFVFPAECQYCRAFAGDDRIGVFCRACWESITLVPEPVCPCCGQPFRSSVVLRHAPEFLCGHCRRMPPFFDQARGIAVYEGVMRAAVHHLKFHQKASLALPLARFMLAHLPPSVAFSDYHAVLPVPLHPSRQRQRGYNQTALLARPLAGSFKLPLLCGNLIRIRPTPEQALITTGRQARQDNVRNAFRVRDLLAIRNKRLILVDDVVTTGATVNECARVLKAAGAASVLVLALSRPLLKI